MLPKKRRRIINISNREYHWTVNTNDNWFDLVIQLSSGKGQKVIAQLGFDTRNGNEELFIRHYDISPYLVRKVIFYALQNGYTPESNNKDLRLFDVWLKLDLGIPGKRKTIKLLNTIDKRIANYNIQNEMYDNQLDQVKVIIKETRQFIDHGEWFVGFEIMIENLFELDVKLEDDEIQLIKEILKSKNINWKKELKWISEMEMGKYKSDNE